MIDTWHILFVINFYLNLKINSIIFIDGLDKVVRQKLNETWENWKRSKMSWMGITWGNMEDGWMGPKHSSQNVTCFGGICFGGSSCPNIEMHIGLFTKTWHVLVNGRFWGSCFEAHVSWHVIFNWLKRLLGCHQNMTCFYVSLFWGSCSSCMKTCVGPPQSERCIYYLSLK